ncbi:4'-phosphopantetheinyl transferase superfamily protein [Roseibium sp. RKSG952]|uniref:4'-phosphopantetheinyl transferase family protein n=1 Tax=Roseibium sp. RKSG952 TaxID=2529384 RepID=UPI0018AD0FBC
MTADLRAFPIPEPYSEVLEQGMMINAGLQDGLLVMARFHQDHVDPQSFARFGIPFDESLKRAVVSRRAEFLATRVLGKLMLRQLGLSETAIGRSADRSPIWPAGCRGAISHTSGVCAVIALRGAGGYAGVDVETIVGDQTRKEIAESILTPPEMALLGNLSEPEANHLLTLLFSAKETLFKALYPQVLRFFGFECAQMVAPPQGGQLGLRLTTGLTPDLTAGRAFHLRYMEHDCKILTWMTNDTCQTK